MSKEEVAAEAKISILASPENAYLLLKAAKNAPQEDLGVETINDFERQNPASKHLMVEVQGVFAQAAKNLAKEVQELLGADNK